MNSYITSNNKFVFNQSAEQVSDLPPGLYRPSMTMEGIIFFTKVDMVTDELIQLPNTVSATVIDRVKNFWSTGISDKYKEYGIVYKLGVLVHGKPGTGKTATLTEIIRAAVDMGAVCLFSPNPGLIKDFVDVVRTTNKESKILVVYEEFDSVLKNSEEDLLSILDGETQIENVVYLATTNYISKIPARIKNRPSRFSTVVEMTAPNEETRRLYFKSKLKGGDVEKLESFVQASDGMVIDQLKDIVTQVCIYGQDISDTIRNLKEMEAESVGYDDYNEKQAREVFKYDSKDKLANTFKPVPLK